MGRWGGGGGVVEDEIVAHELIDVEYIGIYVCYRTIPDSLQPTVDLRAYSSCSFYTGHCCTVGIGRIVVRFDVVDVNSWHHSFRWSSKLKISVNILRRTSGGIDRVRANRLWSSGFVSQVQSIS